MDTYDNIISLFLLGLLVYGVYELLAEHGRDKARQDFVIKSYVNKFKDKH